MRFHLTFFLLVELPVTALFAYGVYQFHLWALS